MTVGNHSFRSILDNIKLNIRSQLVHLCNQRNIKSDIILEFQSELMTNSLTGPGLVKIVGLNTSEECLYFDANKEGQFQKVELGWTKYDYRGCSYEQPLFL